MLKLLRCCVANSYVVLSARFVNSLMIMRKEKWETASIYEVCIGLHLMRQTATVILRIMIDDDSVKSKTSKYIDIWPFLWLLLRFSLRRGGEVAATCDQQDLLFAELFSNICCDLMIGSWWKANCATNGRNISDRVRIGKRVLWETNLQFDIFHLRRTSKKWQLISYTRWW